MQIKQKEELLFLNSLTIGLEISSSRIVSLTFPYMLPYDEDTSDDCIPSSHPDSYPYTAWPAWQVPSLKFLCAGH